MGTGTVHQYTSPLVRLGLSWFLGIDVIDIQGDPGMFRSPAPLAVAR